MKPQLKFSIGRTLVFYHIHACMCVCVFTHKWNISVEETADFVIIKCIGQHFKCNKLQKQLVK